MSSNSHDDGYEPIGPVATALYEKIEARIQAVVPNEPSLVAAANAITADKMPDIAIQAAQGQFLSILCQMISAKNILEVGALAGYSALWFASSAPDVRVTSIEYDPKHHAVATRTTAHVADRVHIELGAALDVLPRLAADIDAGKSPKYDFVFLDANWEEQGAYYDWAVKMTRSGGIVYVDNAVRNITQGDDPDNLVNRVKGDKRVSATLMPTLSHWRKTVVEVADGFLLARVS